MTKKLPRAATDIASAIAKGELSAREVTDRALDSIENSDKEIGAFTNVTRERARAEAEAIDKLRENGASLPPLAGVPYAVKNLFDIEGIKTLAGSKINQDLPPANEDAVVVQRMKQAGAILLGGLNMGEFAYDFTGENAHYGPSRNPLDKERMTGGSSGGPAAAVAAGFVPLSLGSDTNGSIRVPAAFCGLYGLKPTYGRLPRNGTFPFCDSLDHVGPFATNPVDLATTYDALQGPYEEDPTCAQRPLEPTLPELTKGVEGLRIAVAGGYFRRDADQGALTAVDLAAKHLGATEDVDIPDVEKARAAAFLITNAEGSTFHLDSIRLQIDDFDPDTRDRFLAGATLPASWYISAQRFRRQFAETMRKVFQNCDVLIAPATPCSAPKIGQKMMTLEGNQVPLRAHIGIFTQPISFVGLPVAAAPVWVDDPMPYGVQIIAPPWREDLCLRVAHALAGKMVKV